MQDETEYEDVEQDVGEPVPSMSLSARMEERAAELAKQHTGRFAVPGYEGILEVELRSLGYTALRKAQKRNEKVRDETTRELYSMADQLLAATVGFHEVFPNGRSQPIADDWVSLAKRRADAPEAPTPRQALLFVVTEKRLLFLFAKWGEWASAYQQEITDEVIEDFATTG